MIINFLLVTFPKGWKCTANALSWVNSIYCSVNTKTISNISPAGVSGPLNSSRTNVLPNHPERTELHLLLRTGLSLLTSSGTRRTMHPPAGSSSTQRSFLQETLTVEIPSDLFVLLILFAHKLCGLRDWELQPGPTQKHTQETFYTCRMSKRRALGAARAVSGGSRAMAGADSEASQMRCSLNITLRVLFSQCGEEMLHMLTLLNCTNMNLYKHCFMYYYNNYYFV